MDEKQTYGIEIEMYHMSREGVAKHVSSYFKCGKPYGTDLFHYKYRNWALKDNKQRLWQFRVDGSIQRYDKLKPANHSRPLRKYDRACELITPPLAGEKDLDDLCAIVQRLIDNGAHSNAGMKCSVHIHLGLMDHTAQSLCRLAHLHAMLEPEMIKTFNISEHRLRKYCQKTSKTFLKMIDDEKPQTISEFCDIWYKAHGTEDTRQKHYNKSRYHMINFHAIACHGTVEFRGFQFTPDLNTAQLRQFLSVCMAINEYSKTDLPLEEFKLQ